MKNLLVLFVAALSLGVPTQSHAIGVTPVDLELTSTSGIPTETVAGTTGAVNFSLDVDVQDPTFVTTGTMTLAGFDITLGALPSGLTFDGFSNLLTGFTANNSTGLSYSATIPSPYLTIGATQTTLVVANFTATATGTYALDFIPQSSGAGTGLTQELFDPSGDNINYTDVGNTVLVATVPEPAGTTLLLFGLAALAGLGLFARGQGFPCLSRVD